MTGDPKSPEGDSPSWIGRLMKRDGNKSDKPAAAGAAGNPWSIEADALDALRVADVMVPRADIVGVEVATPLGELATIFSEAAHSRLPVYRDTLDDPVGVVHIKDVIGRLAPNGGGERDDDWAEQKVLADISRPLLFAPHRCAQPIFCAACRLAVSTWPWLSMNMAARTGW